MNGESSGTPLVITLSSDDEDEEKTSAAEADEKLAHSSESQEKLNNETLSVSSRASTSRESGSELQSAGECSRASTSRENVFSSSGQPQIAHNIFENLLVLCAKCLKLPDDQPILEKLKKFYNATDIQYKASKEFVEYVKQISEEILPSNIYEKLKPLMDLLKAKKIRESTESDGNSTSDRKREIRRKVWIARLEDNLQRLDKKIKEVSEREVDLHIDDDSIYILEDKLKRKFMRTYRELCRLNGERGSTAPSRRKISYHGTRYHEINKYLSKYVNKLKEPPDFQDILTAISEAAEKFHIDLCDSERYRTAREAFPAIMSMIQKSRINEFIETFGTHTTDSVDLALTDPALSDEQLKSKLQENSATAKTKLDEIFEKYERLQEEKSHNGDQHEDEVENDEEETEELEESDSDGEGSSLSGDETEENDKIDKIPSLNDHKVPNGNSALKETPLAEVGNSALKEETPLAEVENCNKRSSANSPIPTKVESKKSRTESCSEIIILD